MILALVPESDPSDEITRLRVEHQVQLLRLAQDPDAYDRLQELNG